MIVRMNKYTFVVLDARKEDFLAALQELGLVDVTVTGWEPSEEDRLLMGQIENHREAVEYLGNLRKAKGFTAGKPYGTGTEAFDKYRTARHETALLEGEIARYEKLAADARPWGKYDPEALRQLAARGIAVRYFIAPDTELEKRRGEWGENLMIKEINNVKGTSYFAVVGAPAENRNEEGAPSSTEVNIDAQEVKLPAESPAQIAGRLKELRAELGSWDKVFASAAATLPAIEAEGERLKDRLQFHRSTKCGEKAADGALVVMEAWARERQASEVERMLDGYPDVVYLKEQPTPDDETPVELKNNSFASPFEFIGDLYAKPKYGTMDLTRWFAPFFMLFFGMCMGDLGYGTLLFLGGLGLTLRSKKESMKQIGRLTMFCGGAAMVVGFIMGGLFGTSLSEWRVLAPIKNIFIDSNSMFYVAVAVGIFQVMFAMVLNVVMTSRAFGIKYALATIGWFVVLATCIAVFGLNKLGVSGFGEGEMFGPWSVAFYVCLGAGAFLMLFFNSPGKNPLVNFGAGLWTTFNRLTGLLGDALSYIRLFAIGLSGGILAQVFNTIAVEISPDIPILGQAVTLLILVIGHSLNLFLSTLSAIVHPLRLTFVEFFNNAGFEAADRTFSPLKHTSKTKL